MKNILSYKPGTRFTGLEIKDWIYEQLDKHTSHERMARYMLRFANIKDDKQYFISIECRDPNHTLNKAHSVFCLRVYRV